MELGEGLRRAIAKLSGATIIDAKAIKDFNKELQRALLSADVEVELVYALSDRIEKAALRERLPEGVSSREYVINMVYDELVELMGKSYEPVLKPKRILLLGLYGSGKTTMAAKLAKFYQNRGFASALVACDMTRPAAYEQLETLASQAGVGFFGEKGRKAGEVAGESLKRLKDKKVIICDTSGRNALDKDLIDELKSVSNEFRPDEKLLVINADTGQVAGKQAREFDRAVGLTGVIVTKIDGSGRGGGALSAVSAANVNVTFIGTGEKLDAVELYDSKKFIGRLLGVPDLPSLIANVKAAVEEANVKPEEMAAEELNFSTFYAQLKTMSKMGPMKNVVGMLGLSSLPKEVAERSEEKLKRYKVIIESMTEEERNDGRLASASSRIKRIAKGSGTSEKDVRELLGDFNKMKKLYTAFKSDRTMRKQFSKFMPKEE